MKVGLKLLDLIRMKLMLYKKVVILNAPPFSGKDTLADLMVKHLKATKHEFKAALYEAFAAHYRLPIQYVLEICTSRKWKDNLKSAFSINSGRTPREGLMHVSEDVYKVNFGKDYFGQQAANKLQSGVNAFSDGGGWWDELAPVVCKSDQVIICRLYRNGFNFNKDSRNYYNEFTMPKDFPFTSKVQICDIHLEENNPYAALDAIAGILNNDKV